MFFLGVNVFQAEPICRRESPIQFALYRGLRSNYEHSAYYPDVMLVCDSRDDEDNYKQSPCFIAEVLSQSTEITDRREKCLAYQKMPSLRYYLLASSDSMHADYFQRDQSGEWQMAMLESGETLTVECESYRAVLTLDDIYEDVVFD
ncbi:Uma2 family endonuclease [Methylosarcina fibrata]|uniref:Uma2 family endonuclease n=1 Tax=Methylosarcina fibrata TaxID=105972 RepID=UPI00037763DD|nr:Uma2 family endonuclease [Methylosarcina fibrata]